MDLNTSESNDPVVSTGAQRQRPNGQIGPLAMAWRGRWLIICSVIVSVLAMLGYFLVAIPIYQSSSVLYVERYGPTVINRTEGVMMGSPRYMDTQAQLISSTPILEDAYSHLISAQMRTFDRPDDVDPVFILKKMVKAHVDKGELLTLSVDSPYAEEGAVIVNTIIDAYLRFHNKRKQRTAAEVLKILNGEKQKSEAELVFKFKAMIDFQQTHPELTLISQQSNGDKQIVSKVDTRRLDQLRDELTSAEIKVIDLKSTYTALEKTNDDALATEVLAGQLRPFTQHSLDRERQQLLKTFDQLVAKLQTQRRVATDDHPTTKLIAKEAQEVRDRLDAVTKQIQQVRLDTVQRLYVTGQDRYKQLRQSYDNERKRILAMGSIHVNFIQLESEWRQTKKLVDMLNHRIREIDIDDDAGVLNITTLEVAQVSDLPIKPEKTKLMLLALVAGAVMGLGLTVSRELLDHRIRSTEEISALLDLPVLGMIPNIRGRESDLVSAGLTAALQPQSVVAEAFRTVRTALFFGLPKSQNRTLLITSPLPNDGKSTIVSNLGIVLSQAGYNTLVVDADFRRSSQQKIFNVDDQNGLAHVIVGHCPLDLAIQNSEFKGLDVLPAGPKPPNPSELLNSETFGVFVKEASKRYDIVLIDSPPVVPVTDALILAGICDVTLLVTRLGHCTRKAALHSHEALSSVGGKVFGVVVNDVPSGGPYGYGYQAYAYDSRQGADSSRATGKSKKQMIASG